MDDLIRNISEQFILPVIRSSDPSEVADIVEALAKADYKVLEVTLMSPELLPLYSELRSRYEIHIGAGTVLNAQQAQEVIRAGADFLVSPGLGLDVLSVAQKNQKLYIPGVMTPTEVTTAVNHGCSVLKLFPVSAVGRMNYVKSLSAPFPRVKWLLSGGVKLSEVKDCRHPSVVGVGVGEELFPPELCRQKDWEEITQRARGAKSSSEL